MISPNFTLITTEDGSKSVLREDIDETYHSTRGAQGESEYVFIEKGLAYLYENNHSRKIDILEIGLGTGLNALLTAIYAESNAISIHYHTLEPIPVPYSIYNELGYGSNEEESIWLKKIHESPWEQPVEVSKYLTLHKYKIGLEDFFMSKSVNLIYFDAFAPSKQAELWEIENLRKCYKLLTAQGVLTTYCAQGQFKRNMAAIGFAVETLPGALGKKEMVRGLK